MRGGRNFETIKIQNKGGFFREGWPRRPVAFAKKIRLGGLLRLARAAFFAYFSWAKNSAASKIKPPRSSDLGERARRARSHKVGDLGERARPLLFFVLF